MSAFFWPNKIRNNHICYTRAHYNTADPSSHTYLPEVACYAWSIGLPREQIAICQIGDSFYCIDEESQVLFWKKGRFSDKVWESFWHWAEDVWLNR